MNGVLPAETYAERLDAVRGQVAAACARAGREADTVTLVAVAKKFGPDAVTALAEAGVDVFGENRVQEAAQKIPLCPGRLEWHMVGHLQSNKARFVPEFFRMVHSVDSWKLLEALNRACEAAGVRMPVCLQINVAGESSKFGLAPDDAPPVFERAGGLANVDIVGLMTIPPFTPDPEGARPHFRRLRELREAWRAATGYALDTLSMGMSNDFPVAIEEGATLIRLGTILFGEREKHGKA